jgi:hypothetical protein
MKKRILTVLLASVLAVPCGAAPQQQTAHAACDVDRARLLALDETQFDQDESGGWRTLAARPGCDLAAADLLRDYRQLHRNEAGIMYWHEGQLRAFAGQPQEAIALMERSRKPGAADRAGWNPYVDATIAFLRKDRAALDNARLRLAAVPPPTGEGAPRVVDGFIEADFPGGQKRKIRWPINIDVVEGLVHCFDKPYGEAYGNECRLRAE